jgi:DnaD/phage-associated family protein
MASYYWIKLYHEIIEDPKMALLPDRLWRRVIELFLLAGKHGQDGLLPETRQLAWELRINADDLDMDLKQIETTGIIKRSPTGWVITNFKKRQSPSTSTERSKEFRKRNSNTNETDVQRNVAQIQIQITDTDTEKETEKNTSTAGVDYNFGSLCTVYEKNIGALTPMVAESLQSDLSQYGLQDCMDAITEALRNNVRKWSYVQGILKRWSIEGKAKKPGAPPPRMRKLTDAHGVTIEVPA